MPPDRSTDKGAEIERVRRIQRARYRIDGAAVTVKAGNDTAAFVDCNHVR